MGYYFNQQLQRQQSTDTDLQITILVILHNGILVYYKLHYTYILYYIGK